MDLRILISVDIEGISGVTTRFATVKGNGGYKEASTAMTLEVNAAISGCFEAGATEVYVVDGHASGDNLDLSLLDSRAICIPRDENLMMVTGIGNVDALVCIGYHGMVGVPNSFCAHTNSTKKVESLKINDIKVSEGITNALIAKHFGKKTIFISGTDYGIREIKDYVPNIQSVITLTSIDFENASSGDVDKLRLLIHEKVKKSIIGKEEISMISWDTNNMKFEINLNMPLKDMENVEISNEGYTVKFENNVVDGYATYRKILSNIN